METEFKRDALYEEVWATPLTRIATKYGLSDNGLRKVCRAMNIPLPHVGHWAKIAAGHQIVRPPLPAEAGRTIFRSDPPQQKWQFHKPEDKTWLAQQLAFERRTENAVVFEAQPRVWHPIADKLRERIREAEKDVVRWREKAEARKRAAGRRKSEPDFDSWEWISFLSGGQLLTHAPLKVTPRGQERALLIVNALCIGAEARGFTVGLNKERTRIVLDGHGAILTMRLAEQLRLEVQVPKLLVGLVPDAGNQRMPTGILRIFLEGAASEIKVADDQTSPLETTLNLVFERVWTQVVRYREVWREREDRERQWKLAEERRKTAAQRAANERQLRETLLSEAADWQRTEIIRQYVAYVGEKDAKISPDGASTESVLSWSKWALAVAEELDPTTKRIAELRGGPVTAEQTANSGPPTTLQSVDRQPRHALFAPYQPEQTGRNVCSQQEDLNHGKYREGDGGGTGPLKAE